MTSVCRIRGQRRRLFVYCCQGRLQRQPRARPRPSLSHRRCDLSAYLCSNNERLLLPQPRNVLPHGAAEVKKAFAEALHVPHKAHGRSVERRAAIGNVNASVTERVTMTFAVASSLSMGRGRGRMIMAGWGQRVVSWPQHAAPPSVVSGLCAAPLRRFGIAITVAAAAVVEVCSVEVTRHWENSRQPIAAATAAARLLLNRPIACWGEAYKRVKVSLAADTPRGLLIIGTFAAASLLAVIVWGR